MEIDPEIEQYNQQVVSAVQEQLGDTDPASFGNEIDMCVDLFNQYVDMATDALDQGFTSMAVFSLIHTGLLGQPQQALVVVLSGLVVHKAMDQFVEEQTDNLEDE